MHFNVIQLRVPSAPFDPEADRAARSGHAWSRCRPAGLDGNGCAVDYHSRREEFGPDRNR